MIHGFYAIAWSLQLTSARFITTRQQSFPSWVVEDLPVTRAELESTRSHHRQTLDRPHLSLLGLSKKRMLQNCQGCEFPIGIKRILLVTNST